MPEIKTNSPVVRYAELRAVNEEDRSAEFVISTEAEDTFGTIFELAGWKFTRYETNPIVCYVHRSSDPNPDFVIGTSTVFVENGQVIGRVVFEPENINPLAEKVFRKVQHGTLRMASIAALPLQARWGDFSKGENPDVLRFTEQELLEWSIVPLGSNPEALKRSADVLLDILKELPKQTGEAPAEHKRLSTRNAQFIINQNRYKHA